jgi:aminoglycoside phosphotransferase (APT) family kinase protein
MGPRHAAEVARRAGAAPVAGAGSDLDAVLAAWPAAARELAATEVTLSHGECYASNVLVTDRGRVAVVDWETAALGSGWEDLAALVTGWSSEVRERLLEAYVRAAPPDAGLDPRRLLDAARLQLCLQWIGSDPAWRPPPEHRTDWLAEAVCIVEDSPWPS